MIYKVYFIAFQVNRFSAKQGIQLSALYDLLVLCNTINLLLYFSSFNFDHVGKRWNALFVCVLSSSSAKGRVVPGHVGSFHVCEVNINPETDQDTNNK